MVGELLDDLTEIEPTSELKFATLISDRLAKVEFPDVVAKVKSYAKEYNNQELTDEEVYKLLFIELEPKNVPEEPTIDADEITNHLIKNAGISNRKIRRGSIRVYKRKFKIGHEFNKSSKWGELAKPAKSIKVKRLNKKGPNRAWCKRFYYGGRRFGEYVTFSFNEPVDSKLSNLFSSWIKNIIEQNEKPTIKTRGLLEWNQ